MIDALWRHARACPNAPAVGEAGGAGRSCTYGELWELASIRARWLGAAVSPGRVVMAVLPGGVDFVAWFCAAIAAGVRFLPMHPHVAGPEALAIAERVGAAAALAAPGVPAEAGLRHLTLTSTAEGHGLRDGIAERRGSLGAVVLGSSGTMGLPKLVLRESPSLDADAAGVIAGMALTPEDRVVFATPLSHSYGVDVLLGVLTAGAALRVAAQFDAQVVTRELEAGATVLPGVPFIFEALARHKRSRPIALRLALSAGSPLPPRVRAEFVDAWGIEVGQLYGATELGTVAVCRPGTSGFEPESVGCPLPGVSMRVGHIDDPSRTLRAGDEGHLLVRAPSMLSGYLDGELDLVDGHLLTGDLAKIDQRGRVWVTGRLKALIDIGAYKVNPIEIENVLRTHPGVAECAVVALRVSETVGRLRAVVVPRGADPHPTADELRRFVRERLSPVKVPRVVEFAASIPKSPTGKVLRDQL